MACGIDASRPCIHGAKLAATGYSLSLLAGFRPGSFRLPCGRRTIQTGNAKSILATQPFRLHKDETQHMEFNHGLGNEVNGSPGKTLVFLRHGNKLVKIIRKSSSLKRFCSPAFRQGAKLHGVARFDRFGGDGTETCTIRPECFQPISYPDIG